MDERDEDRWPDKGLWIYPQMLLGLLLEPGGVVVLLLLWLRYGSWPFLAGGSVIGSLVIWRIVRWVNRRDDPCAKPPCRDPDGPFKPK